MSAPLAYGCSARPDGVACEAKSPPAYSWTSAREAALAAGWDLQLNLTAAVGGGYRCPEHPRDKHCADCGAVVTYEEWTNGASDAVGGEGWVDGDGGLHCPVDPEEWWGRSQHRVEK